MVIKCVGSGSVYVVRAFVHLRQMIASHKDLAKIIDEMEEKYDHQFRAVFETIKQLLAPPVPFPFVLPFNLIRQNSCYFYSENVIILSC
jgi:hypothetical protein